MKGRRRGAPLDLSGEQTSPRSRPAPQRARAPTSGIVVDALGAQIVLGQARAP
jgi:hypothetical protein